MFRPSALLKYGTLSIALLAMSHPAVAQSDALLRAEVDALRKENATLRQQNRVAPRPAAVAEPSPLQANAADIPVKAPAPAIVAGPSWAGFYIGAGVSRERRKTTQGDVLVTAVPVPAPNPSITRDLTLDQFASSTHVLGGFLVQYNRAIFGVEGDYNFGGQTSQNPRFLVPANCTGGVITTGNFGCGSGASFGSFETLGHLRAIAGVEFTPRFMGFVAGGLAVGRLGAGGIQVGGILVGSPFTPSAGSVTSNYGAETLYGWTWGGGIQAKLNESLVARLEYLRDEYNGPSQPARSQTITVGPYSVTATSRPQDIQIVNQALRASLIYRFDPNVPFYEAAQRDFAQFGRFEGTGSAFAGFYAGVGISQNNYVYNMRNSVTLTIDDSNTPGVDVSERRDSILKGGSVGKNFLLGYRYQAGRLILGAEREFVRDSRKDLEKSVGIMGFADSGRDFTCYSQFGAGNIVCLGLDTSKGAVETRGRFRGTAGIEITPSFQAFVGYGRAYGQARGTSGSSQGIVWVPPSAPLVGAATVTRFQTNDISGHTFGGGVEFKATDNLIFRADYWRDHYNWAAINCGGAGFGGTIGTITTNSFSSCVTPVKITNEAFQATLIYQLWNPQGGGGTGGGSPLTALAGLVGSPMAAFAQADPVYKAPRASLGYNWTGYYAGAHGGWGWSHQRWTGDGVFEGDFGANGWLAGAQAGYNYQVNQWVFGVELDGNFTDIAGQWISARPPTGAQPDVLKVEVEGTVTLAGRVGWAVNNYLLYGKAGFAFMHNHVQYTDNGAGNAHVWKGGWMLGAGAEYGITPTISAKLEYNYMNFGTRGYDLTPCNSCADDVDLRQSIHLVKAGINWRLWNPNPVVARY